MTDTPHRDPTQEFANRIVAELENGVKPRGPAVGPR
jgi:antirestriction protein ArdC